MPRENSSYLKLGSLPRQDDRFGSPRTQRLFLMVRQARRRSEGISLNIERGLFSWLTLCEVKEGVQPPKEGSKLLRWLMFWKASIIQSVNLVKMYLERRLYN